MVGMLVPRLLAGTVTTEATVTAPAWTAYVANQGSGTVTPVDTATNMTGTPISAGSEPGAVAITPDGKTAYVVNQDADTVTPITIATNAPGHPIQVGRNPNGIAITPNGTAAYVANGTSGTVTPINIATNTVGAAITVGGFPFAIAITPNGSTVYVDDDAGHTVTPIDVATGVAETPITVGTYPWGIAITPDGTTVYVVNHGSHDVTPISTATNLAGSPITVSASPTEIAITPDGTTAYVSDGGADLLTPIDLATETAETAIPVNGGSDVAITPDGATAYVTTFSNMVYPIDLASGTVGTAITVGNESGGIAITPDQAPVAKLSVVAASLGTASTFDASASTVAFGTIASYAWNFGDGDTATTTTPTTTHTYASAGTYTVMVTGTSSGGTSTAQVFTGSSMTRNGGPSATASHVAIVSAPGAYTALSPYRICDTRASRTPDQCTSHPLGANGTVAVHVTGQTGPLGQSVPGNAPAVVVNVTALSESAVNSYLSVFPTGEAVPAVSNINFDAGATQANLVIVQLGAGGEISIHNAVGTAGVLIDVEGYFAPPGSAPVAGEFHSMPPLRICDTRASTHTACSGATADALLGADTWRRVVLSGLPTGAPGGTPSIPTGGAADAVFNLTATEGTKATYLAVAAPNSTTDACPTASPSASNLNPAAGESLPNRVISTLGPHQDICVYNAAGTVDFIIDVNGWFGNGLESSTGALFYAVPPTRICDTRAHSMTTCAGEELTAKSTETVDVAGNLIVPADGGTTNPVAVVANLTGVVGTAGTVFTVYPSDATRPVASDLNPRAGDVIANLAIVAIATTGPDIGDVSLYNGVGDINAILDVSGWFQ
jgi:YVTN family beta-propeller protein